MKYFKWILHISVLSVMCSNIFAQSQWRYLPNIGLDKDSLDRIQDIYFMDTSTGVAVAAFKLYKTTDGGVHWTVKNDTSLNTHFRSVEFLDDKKTGIAGSVSKSGTVLLTTDAGENWTDISNRLSDTSRNDRRICGISHVGDAFYAVGAWSSYTAKFYKSVDKGNTWSTHYFDTLLATQLVDVHFINNNTGFVTGKKLELPSYKESAVILKTTDGGNSWHTVFSDTVFSGYIWKIQFIDNQYVVAAVQNKFYKDSVVMLRSVDGGNNWNILPVGNTTNVNNRINRHVAWTQGCGFINRAKGWVGGYYEGVFETNDSGKTWQYLKFGYDFNRIFVIDSTHVFAGGAMPYKYGTGINLLVKEPPLKSEHHHRLYPVVPNPAKGNINIRFELTNETNVVLEVVSIDNKKVYSVVNTHLHAGDYSYSWDSSNAPAGNYFVWLGNNEVPITERFVLLK